MRKRKEFLIFGLLTIIIVFIVAVITTIANNQKVDNIAQIEEKEKKAVYTSGDFMYEVNAVNNTAMINNYIGSSNTVIIPSTIDGYSVTAIYHLFTASYVPASNITYVYIPNTVTLIGSSAFRGCTNLQSITIPSSVTEIEADAFSDTGITEIYIPSSVTKIASTYSYSNGTYTQAYPTPFGTELSKIEVDSANQYYSSVNGVLYNKNKTELIKYPSSCQNTYFKIPNTVRTIASSAFYNCFYLMTIELEENSQLSVITPWAIEECNSLRRLELPGTITKICDYAIKNNPNLTIYCDSGSLAQTYAVNNNINYELRVLSISVSTLPTQVKYIQNSQNLNLSGGKILVEYANKNVTVDMTDNDVVTTGFNNAVLGLQTINVMYENKITTFTVEIIKKEVSEIYIKTKPTKTTYIQNYETLNLTGGVLSLMYNDYTMSELYMTETGVTASGFNNTILGTNTITLTYQGKTVTFSVTIVAKSLKEIQVKTMPSVTEYIQYYETLDLSGGELTLIYNAGEPETISMTASGVTTTGFSNTTLGKKSITVQYGGKSTVLEVNIIEKTLLSISVKQKPSKLSYIQNFESLNLSDGIIELVYNAGDPEMLSMTSDSVQNIGFSNTTLGTKTITIIYNGKSCYFDVEIVEKSLSGISIKTNPSKTTYIQNYETLDLTGGKITLTYNDTSTEEKNMSDSEVNVTGFDNTTLGRNMLTVTYAEKTTTFDVTIVAKSLSSISVKTNPTKTTYIQNYETLDLAGGRITLTYNDTSTEEKNMSDSGVNVTGFDNRTIGTNTLTVAYGEKTATFDVTIIEKILTELVIKTNPSKITYIQNYETLDLAGGKITLTYNDTITEEKNMSASGVNVTGFDNRILGTNTLTVSYGEKTATFDVTIVAKSLSSISVKTNPSKTTYIQNYETLDLTGGKITLTYNDTSTEEKNMSDTGVSITGFNNSTLGTNILTVTYGEKTATFNVTIVAKELTGIVVKTNPSKTTYIQNYETLDLTGGKITLTYNDTSTEDKNMSDTGVSVTGFDNRTVGTNTLTVTYGRKTATFDVTIIEKVLTGIEIKTKPSKTTYIQNKDNLNLVGGKITLIYNNIFTEEKNMSDSEVGASDFDNTTLGKQTITLTYEGKITTFEVNVIREFKYEVNSSGDGIVITEIPKLDTTSGSSPIIEIPSEIDGVPVIELGEYLFGDIKNVNTVKIPSSITKPIPNNIFQKRPTTASTNLRRIMAMAEGAENASETTFECESTSTIWIQFAIENDLNYEITDKTIASISMHTNLNNLVYLIGDTELDLTGGRIKLTYTDGTESPISIKKEGVEVDALDASTSGTKSIGVEYKTKTTTFDVEVLPLEAESIIIKSNPSKTTYIQNYETLDLTGGKIEITYNNKTTEEKFMTDSGVNVTGFDNTTLGTKMLIVTYEGKTSTFNVEIVAKTLNSISITTNPSKTTYIQNYETLDLAGGKITLTYDDTSTEEKNMSDTGVNVTGFDNTTSGTNTLTVTYGGKTATFDVTIVAKELTGITVTTNPTKTTYIQNYETLDLTGGKITLTYNDTSTEEKNMSDTGVSVTGFDNTTLGNKEITITYEGKSAKFNVNIIQNIKHETDSEGTGIKITDIPNTEDGKTPSRVEIPSEIDGKPVTEIDEDTFKNKTEIDTVYIPDTVTKIPENAFEGCDEITIECETGSYAEEYAKEHGMNYELIDKIIDSISIHTKPTKIEYKVGETQLDVTGGRIKLTYTDGTESPISMKKSGVKVDTLDASTSGTKTIGVEYKTKTISFNIEVKEDKTIQQGDINGDGQVNSTDLLLLKRHIIAVNKTEWILTGDKFEAGDINSDQKINATDLLLLKRKIVNK